MSTDLDRSAVWALLEDVGKAKRYLEAGTNLQLQALDAVGFVTRTGDEWEVTDIGRAFLGGLYGGAMNRTNPFSAEPYRSIWAIAAEMSAEQKRSRRRARKVTQ